MSVRCKILDGGAGKWCFIVRENILLADNDAPDLLDVPLSYTEDSPMVRYKFRFKADGTHYYTPVDGTPMDWGNA